MAVRTESSVIGSSRVGSVQADTFSGGSGLVDQFDLAAAVFAIRARVVEQPVVLPGDDVDMNFFAGELDGTAQSHVGLQ